MRKRGVRGSHRYQRSGEARNPYNAGVAGRGEGRTSGSSPQASGAPGQCGPPGTVLCAGPAGFAVAVLGDRVRAAEGHRARTGDGNRARFAATAGQTGLGQSAPINR